jgi:integrase
LTDCSPQLFPNPLALRPPSWIGLARRRTTHAKLANGKKKIYWYAWRGGPKLRGEPGSSDFIASYNEAAAQRAPTPQGKLQFLIDGYQQSGEFRTLRERTKADYIKQIKLIEEEFSDFPIKALAARETRGVFMDWRDKLAVRSVRQADYAWTVLARILSWAKNRGKITVNPCERGGRLYNGTRVDFVWTLDDEAAFLANAPAHLHLALLLALWSGQRQGDLLGLTWSAYDGSHIRLKQSKSQRRGARRVVHVNVPIGAPLKAALDQVSKNKQSPIVLLNSEGRPWTPDGFRASWGKACKKAGIEEVTFNDLRGTAVTRLALVGCTEAEIASITGHSIRDVRSILDAHYLHRDQALAENAIRKLEMGYAQGAGKTGTDSTK